MFSIFINQDVLISLVFKNAVLLLRLSAHRVLYIPKFICKEFSFKWDFTLIIVNCFGNIKYKLECL